MNSNTGLRISCSILSGETVEWKQGFTPDEGLRLPPEPAHHLPPPEGHVKGEVVQAPGVEAVDVGGAVHHGRHASRLKTRQVTSSLKIRILTLDNRKMSMDTLPGLLPHR